MRKFLLLLKREDGGAMIFVLSLTIILNILLGAFFFTSRVTTRVSGVRREKVGALNVAEAGKERFMAKLHIDTLTPNKKWTPFKNELLGSGKYTVTCSTGTNTDTVIILSEGEEGGFKSKIEVIATKKRELPIDNLSARIPAAVVCKGSVELKGSIEIDGRDHDENATSTDNSQVKGKGVFGVVTCGLFQLNGNGSVWGNGFGPLKKKNYPSLKDTVYRENVFPCVIPLTPEEVLGVPPGTLEKYKIKADEFKQPFEGIVYVTERVKNIQGTSKGILIVHNNSYSAFINNINANARFEGIIICDDVRGINGTATIVGAIVVLASTTDVGNGNGKVLYSKKVLDNLDKYVPDIKKWNVKQLSWREL